MAKRGTSTVVPRLRFPEFHEQAGWAAEKLGQLATLITKGTTPTSVGFQFVEQGINFIKIESITEEGLIDLSKASAISVECHEALNRSQLETCDLLFSIAGALGVTAVVSDAILPANTNQALAIIRLKDKRSLGFIEKYLGAHAVKSEIEKIKAGAAQPNLSLDQVGKFEVALPSAAEQQKIADCLTSLDEVIAAQGRKVEALKAHKRGLMQQLFPREGETRPRLRFPEFRNAPEWTQKALSRICEMQAGKFVSASAIAEKQGEGMYPCYGGNGMRGYARTFTHSGLYPLIGRQGALCGNVQLARGDFHATEHALVASPRPGVDVDWLFYTLDLLNLNRFATGQAQPGLSVDVLNKVECAVPASEKEQRRIADCISSLDAQITAESRQLAALKTHKQGLMQQLFPSGSER